MDMRGRKASKDETNVIKAWADGVSMTRIDHDVDDAAAVLLQNQVSQSVSHN